MSPHVLPTPTLAFYAGVIAIGTLLAGAAYRGGWRRLGGDRTTPTGFGALLAPVMLGAAWISGASRLATGSLTIVAVATAVYWLDDVVQLSARVRLLVSFLTGIGIGLVYFLGKELPPLTLVGILLLAGFACVALTNMVNFYDGADLNLASFVALTAAMLIPFATVSPDWASIGVGALGFILPFAMMNSRPRFIYLGDSGSFAFAGLLTTMVVAFVENIASVAPEAAIPAALPAIDVAYVFAVRVIEKHDMLTRNYLHLYQRLNRRHAGFGYLVPQFTNVALCLSAAVLLQSAGLGRIVSVILAMAGVTVPFYFLCRRLFLAGPPEGPLYETSR